MSDARHKSMVEQADEALFEWLMDHAGELPLRLTKFLANSFPDARVRKRYWAELNVEMGDGTFANQGMLVANTMDSEARITIGNNVSIAPGVILVSDSTPNNSEWLRGFPEVSTRLVKRAPIVIEDDVWLGAGAVILPGITIGRGAIVGAGAVVTRDVEPLAIYAGVPARFVRSLEDGSRRGGKGSS